MTTRATLLLSLVTATAACAADWPHWRGPTHNGISSESILTDWPANGPKKLWDAAVGIGFSGISVAGKNVITVGHHDGKDKVIALDAATGKTLWTYDYEAELGDKYFEGGPTATPTIHEDVVYILGREGQLMALSLKDGKSLWTTNLVETTGARIPDWGFSGSPVVSGKLLILNVGSHGTAVNLATGKVVWKSAEDPSAGYTTPLRLANGSFAFSNTDAYFAVDGVTGQLLWSQEWPTRYGVNAADPIPLSDSTLFIASGYNKGATVIDISGSEPKPIWQNRNMRNQMNPSLLIAGHLYGIDGDESSKPALRCIDAATGKTKWTESSIGAGTLIGVNGGKQMLILSDKGELHLVEPSADAFSSEASAQVLSGRCWTAPTLANGHLYLRNAAGDLLALSLKP
jgi:outer membrane protein assembly factor BamB